MSISDRGVEALRNAIIKKAVREYTSACKHSKRTHTKSETMKELERFFASKWCDTLLESEGGGAQLAQSIRDKVYNGKPVKNFRKF